MGGSGEVKYFHLIRGMEISGGQGFSSKGCRDDYCCGEWENLHPVVSGKDTGLLVKERQNCSHMWRVESVSHSVLSDSLRPHGLYPARFLCPWAFPGKNTGMGRHSILQGIFLIRDWTWVSRTTGEFFTVWVIRDTPRVG